MLTIQVLMGLLLVSLCGYLFVLVRERLGLMKNQVFIKTQKLTQKHLDAIELKVFKLGRKVLYIGDELKIRLQDHGLIRGVLVGAKKKENSLIILTGEDEVLELNVKKIEKVQIIMKYGRLF